MENNPVSLHVNLPPEQLKVFPGIVWLLDPHAFQNQGRTRLMAVVWMAIAMNHPGLPVKVWDHVNTKEGNAHLMSMLKVMIEHDPPFAEQWRITKDAIEFNPKEDETWMQ